MEDYNDYEEIPDEELEEDGELNPRGVAFKLYNRICRRGDWIVMRKKEGIE